MVHSCPTCKVPLKDQAFDGVAFAECPECAGVYIHEEDLRKLETQSVHELDKLDMANVALHPAGSASDVLACPQCDKPMEQFHFLIDGPVLLHRCNACEGLWIEHGKLTQMAAAIEAAHSPATPEERIALNHSAPTAAAPRAESAAEMQFDREHERTMARYRGITAVCRGLSTRMRYGYIPGLGGW
jgi:Zn-finger nucleic acid-binding protein